MSTVLVVDDEPAVLRSTMMLLQDMGFVVIPCPRADDVERLAVQHTPDVILHDAQMPGLDLAEQVTRLRAGVATRSIPIVLFSGGLDMYPIADRLRTDAFLEKPFTPSELNASLLRGIAHGAQGQCT